MSSAQKFVFGTDFREGGRRSAGEADLTAAREEGFRAGREQAQREAQGQADALLGSLARSAERLTANDAQRSLDVEQQAAHLAIALARGLARAALAQKPLAQIEAAVRDCLAHARLAPHLVVRVEEGSVEAVEGLMKRLAHEAGFTGRLIVLPEPGMAPGDGRIEWADGGVALDCARIERLATEAVESVFGALAGATASQRSGS